MSIFLKPKFIFTLYKLIAIKTKDFDEKFDENSSVDEKFGSQYNSLNSHENSIGYIIMKKLNIDSINFTNYGLKRKFNVRKLYLYYKSSLNSNGDIEVNPTYFKIYSQYLGYNTSKDLLDYISDEKNYEFNEEFKKFVSEFTSKKKLSIKQPSEISRIDDHFFGVYEGYFLRAKDKFNSNIDRISKLYLFITEVKHDKNKYKIYIRTTNTNTFNDSCYKGYIEKKNETTIQIKTFLDKQEGQYELMFVFDISSRKIVTQYFNLKGVYSGSDPTTEKPIAGRIILFKIELGKIKISQNEFLNNSSYTPEDVSDNTALEIFNQGQNIFNDNLNMEISSSVEEYQKNLKYLSIKKYFTIEDRYTEQISIIDKYHINKEEISRIVGNYSIYSLHTTKSYITKGRLTVNQFGNVEIIGASITGTSKKLESRKYFGRIEYISNDIYSIIAYETKTRHILSYLLKGDMLTNEIQTNQEDNRLLLNGVRLLVTTTGDKKPLAGRVILLKESDSITNKIDHEKIPLFPKSEVEKTLQTEFFKDDFQTKAFIFNFLFGPENNIISAFKSNNFIVKTIDYDKCFLTYSNKLVETDVNKCLLYLYYAKLNGLIKLSNIKLEFGNKFDIIKNYITELNDDDFEIDFNIDALKININSNNRLELLKEIKLRKLEKSNVNHFRLD